MKPTTFICCVVAVAPAACERQPLESAADASADTIRVAPAADTGHVVYREVENWPALPAGVVLGEVAAVDVDGHGHVFVFHRATRGWDTETRTPIAEPTVLVLDAASGTLLRAWGEQRFRLPHGLTIDAQNNVWLTDAGAHQVLKFTHDGVLLTTLGEAGVARWDRTHFNRPTDVAFGAGGAVYVTDGYENQRVVRFAASGTYLGEWGRLGNQPGEFALPHAIAQQDQRLYVADRDNDRIVVFDSTGAFLRSWSPGNARVYAVAFDQRGLPYAAIRNDFRRVAGVVRIAANGNAIHVIGENGETPAIHDFAIDVTNAIYVAETRSGGLRKFVPVRIPQR
jgi:peptidylamidoglycolate lyase